MNKNTVLTRENAKTLAANNGLSLADLDDFEEVTEAPKAALVEPPAARQAQLDADEKAKTDLSDVGATDEQVKEQPLDPLSKSYLNGAIESLTRTPSPNLTNTKFREDLLHWGALTKQALSIAPSHGAALIAVIQHVGSTEGVLDAVRIIRNVMGQALWQAATDIWRDRNPKSSTATTEHNLSEQDLVYAKLDSMLNVPREAQLNETGDAAPFGLDPTRDPDYVAPPTEAQARASLIQVNAYLGMIADLLPGDDAEREFLQLENGLEFTQRKVDGPAGGTWLPIHDVDQAIEHQIAKNEESFAKRAARRIAAKRDSFDALAKLLSA